MPDSTSTDLNLRTGLPDALRVLLHDYPREGWAQNPGYTGLISFWLDRHMMFRRLLEKLTSDTQERIDGNVDSRLYTQSLSRFGGLFVNELHGHHNIEDVHYFPKLAGLDARISPGFELLDRDHHALDEHLNAFVTDANAVLTSEQGDGLVLGALHDRLSGLSRFLDRHLTDEEELVVPVILKYGAGNL